MKVFQIKNYDVENQTVKILIGGKSFPKRKLQGMCSYKNKSTLLLEWTYFVVNIAFVFVSENFSLLCALKHHFYLVKLAAELSVSLGKIGNCLARVQHCCVVAVANVLTYL